MNNENIIKILDDVTEEMRQKNRARIKGIVDIVPCDTLKTEMKESILKQTIYL